MTARQIPGRPSTCRRCKATIVFARTLAAESGTGGKAMPLDILENPDGNVAVRPVNGHGGLVARVLHKDETHDVYTELRAMPHFATCPGSTDEPKKARLPDGVADLTAARERRRAAAGRP